MDLTCRTEGKRCQPYQIIQEIKLWRRLDLAMDMTAWPNFFTELESCNSLTVPFVKNKKIWTEPTSWNAVYSEDPPNMNDIGKLED